MFLFFVLCENDQETFHLLDYLFSLSGDSRRERNGKDDGVEKKQKENTTPEEQVASQINVVPDDRK